MGTLYLIGKMNYKLVIWIQIYDADLRNNTRIHKLMKIYVLIIKLCDVLLLLFFLTLYTFSGVEKVDQKSRVTHL